jgi:hypothetical protein
VRSDGSRVGCDEEITQVLANARKLTLDRNYVMLHTIFGDSVIIINE